MFRIIVILVLLLLPGTLLLAQDFEVSPLIGDGMVIQRDQPVRLWGWAEKRTTISLQFDGTVYHTKARKNGRWEMELPAYPAGGPHTLEIWTKTKRLSYTDILFGDVWLCSGQSNMEWIVADSKNATEEIQGAADPFIRHFKVPHGHAEQPEDRLPGGEWAVCSPETVGNFTAVGYYFARELRKSVKVPIGLINSSWGGSRIEPWMAGELLDVSNLEEARAQILARVGEDFEKTRKSLEAKLGPLPVEERGLQGDVAYWAASNLDETAWKKVELPALWESYGYEGFDGVAWLRKRFDLTETDLQEDITLVLGRIDDSDITWINGQRIGSTFDQWSALRSYPLPKDVLKPGSNLIAIRVQDSGGGGGLAGTAEELYVQVGDEKRSLTGSWKFRVDAFQYSPLHSPNQLHTLLFNKMIHPLLEYPIKGVLWYQGESNTDPVSVPKYAGQFQQLITDWRKRWGIGNFPFLFVQLAAFMPESSVPVPSNWAALRAAQAQALQLPNTAMAVTTDLGEADDIHPRNKQDVGLRLALAALNLAYGKDLPYQGALCSGHQTTGQEVVLRFDGLEGGWKVLDKYGYIRGFALAGPDGVYHWAKARVEGQQIIVWSEQVQQPRLLQFAWSDNPGDANLYNGALLPVAPFELKLQP